MWAYLVIIRFLFCLIIDTVVFHIRFQIMVSVISMEESHPLPTTATEKYLVYKLQETYTGNRKLEDKVPVLKTSFDVKE